jgi:uncharacterized protein YktA (UPF0223 family)
MSNKQQTAVEWYADKFADHLEETYGIKITSLTLLKEAKEMEKAEKIKFATDFFFWWYNQTSGTNTYEAVEKFYNETYGGNK